MPLTYAGYILSCDFQTNAPSFAFSKGGGDGGCAGVALVAEIGVKNGAEDEERIEERVDTSAVGCGGASTSLAISALEIVEGGGNIGGVSGCEAPLAGVGACHGTFKEEGDDTAVADGADVASFSLSPLLKIVEGDIVNGGDDDGGTFIDTVRVEDKEGVDAEACSNVAGVPSLSLSALTTKLCKMKRVLVSKYVVRGCSLVGISKDASVYHDSTAAFGTKADNFSLNNVSLRASIDSPSTTNSCLSCVKHCTNLLF